MLATQTEPPMAGMMNWHLTDEMRSCNSIPPIPQPEKIQSLQEPPASELARIQTFICQRYREQYQASLRSFMPRLLALTDRQGNLLGAVGLREATAPLFLECYLDQPVEALIANEQQRAINRQSIIEVGQFAGINAGATREMIGLLTTHLYHQGYAWVVFTGTRALRNSFKRLGLNPRDLGPVHADRLPIDDPNDWGSYYQHQPRVQYGSIAKGFHSLAAERGEQV